MADQSDPPEKPVAKAPLMEGDRVNQAVALDWFRTRFKGSELCPICQTENWVVGTYAVEVVTAKKGFSAPLMMVTCFTCAYTRLFSVRLIEDQL